MVSLQATFEGWMEVMEDAVDSTDVSISNCLVGILNACFRVLLHTN